VLPRPDPTPVPTPNPKPEKETITVPVTDETTTIEVEVTVTEGKATVENVDLKDLETVIDGNSSTVTIDLSNLEKTITEVELPVEVIEKIAEAAGSTEQTVEIVLSSDVSIQLNASTLNEQVQKTGGTDVTISVESKENAKLTDKQHETVGGRPDYDITMTSGGTTISDMGGEITIHAPYELKNGEKGSGLVVFYVDDHGNRERCETRYDAQNKCVSWKTDHLSLYMLGYEESTVDKCDGGEHRGRLR